MEYILTQSGYMMLCALGSMTASIIVGDFAAKVVGRDCTDFVKKGIR